MNDTDSGTRGVSMLRAAGVIAALMMVVGVLGVPSASAETFNVGYGQTISNTIGVPGDVDTFRWNGVAGQRLSIDWLSGYGLRMRLTAPSGNIIWNQESLSDRWLTLPQSGQYSLSISFGTSSGTGGYSFAIDSVATPQTFAVSYGVWIQDGIPRAGMGRIERPGARDSYQFTGRTGQRLSIDWMGGYGLRMTLRAPNGNVLVNEDGLADRWLTLPQNGGYTLTVGYGTRSSVGDYALKINSVAVPQTFPLSPGISVIDGVPRAGMGNIELPGARDSYQFDARAGQRLSLDWKGGYGLRVTLRDPNGAVVWNERSLADSSVDLSATGRYTLTIGYGSRASVGDYSFELNLIVK